MEIQSEPTKQDKQITETDETPICSSNVQIVYSRRQEEGPASKTADPQLEGQCISGNGPIEGMQASQQQADASAQTFGVQQQLSETPKVLSTNFIDSSNLIQRQSMGDDQEPQLEEKSCSEEGGNNKLEPAQQNTIQENHQRETENQIQDKDQSQETQKDKSKTEEEKDSSQLQDSGVSKGAKINLTKNRRKSLASQLQECKEAKQDQTTLIDQLERVGKSLDGTDQYATKMLPSEAQIKENLVNSVTLEDGQMLQLQNLKSELIALRKWKQSQRQIQAEKNSLIQKQQKELLNLRNILQSAKNTENETNDQPIITEDKPVGGEVSKSEKEKAQIVPKIQPSDFSKLETKYQKRIKELIMNHAKLEKLVKKLQLRTCSNCMQSIIRSKNSIQDKENIPSKDLSDEKGMEKTVPVQIPQLSSDNKHSRNISEKVNWSLGLDEQPNNNWNRGTIPIYSQGARSSHFTKEFSNYGPKWFSFNSQGLPNYDHPHQSSHQNYKKQGITHTMHIPSKKHTFRSNFSYDERVYPNETNYRKSVKYYGNTRGRQPTADYLENYHHQRVRNTCDVDDFIKMQKCYTILQK